MYKKINLRTQEGERDFPFLATGTTAYRYRQIFHQDLMIALAKIEDEDGADTLTGDRLAFIMNRQAEKADMNTLNEDDFIEWADQFDGAELFLHMQDFIMLYIGSKGSISKSKKGVARKNEK